MCGFVLKTPGVPLLCWVKLGLELGAGVEGTWKQTALDAELSTRYHSDR